MPARGADTKASAAPISEPAETEPAEVVPPDPWTPPPDDASLVRKLAWVMQRGGYIQKKGWNDFFKYKYVTEADLVCQILLLLATAGIMIIPDVVDESREPDAVQERSGTSALTRVTIEYTVTDGKETIRFKMPGYGVDRSDKGVYKAVTGRMKYVLMKLFLIETGDDPERDAAQTETSGAGVSITGSQEEGIEKGGRSRKITRYQLQRITATMREKNMDRAVLLKIINSEFGAELVLPEIAEDATRMVLQFLQELESEDAGQLIKALDEWSEGDADA